VTACARKQKLRVQVTAVARVPSFRETGTELLDAGRSLLARGTRRFGLSPPFTCEAPARPTGGRTLRAQRCAISASARTGRSRTTGGSEDSAQVSQGAGGVLERPVVCCSGEPLGRAAHLPLVRTRRGDRSRCSFSRAESGRGVRVMAADRGLIRGSSDDRFGGDRARLWPVRVVGLVIRQQRRECDGYLRRANRLD
jgi:hypothetical protein